MSFLAPWFLLGGLAIAGPILFHLIRRIVRERMLFSSLLFLHPTPPRVTRRRRLENLWLLLLRCLCVLLLATAFARPFFSKDLPLPVAKSEGRQLLLLLDTSASMSREGFWPRALDVARDYLAKAAPSDQIAIVAFDRSPRTVLGFSDWNATPDDQRVAAAEQRLKALAPIQMGTQLGSALTSAAEQFLSDSSNSVSQEHREIVLISDLQEGARLDGLQGYEWPIGIKVVVESVVGTHRGNAGLSILSDRRTGGNESIQVRVTNARDSTEEKFALGWKGSANSERRTLYVPAGQTKTFSVTNVVVPGRSAELQLTGDAESFDNAAYFVNPAIEQVNVAWLGTDSPNDPNALRFYVEGVFAGGPQRKVRIVPTETNASFSVELLRDASLAFITRQLNSSEVEAVRNWLESGRTALLVLKDNQMTPTFAALSSMPAIQLREAASDFALLTQIDFTHPLFTPFADPRYSDFTHIHFWKHRRLELPAGAAVQVLAKFDDGSPALAQLSVGKGTLLVFTSGWHPADSQFALSSRFPPLMQTLLNWSSAGGTERFQFQTGDTIPSPADSARTMQWQKPDGKIISLAAGQAFTDTDQPGIYSVRSETRSCSFAVNLPAEESRTAPISPDELARLGVPIHTHREVSVANTQATARQLQRAEQENRQKLWRWLIVGVLSVLFAEMLLSGLLAKQQLATEASRIPAERAEPEASKEFA